MDLKTSDIIQKCIDEKWIPIKDLKINDRGMENCLLCQKFYNILHEYNHCDACPLSKQRQKCGNNYSVYADFSEAEVNNLRSSSAYKKAAEQMISMLEGVRDFYISVKD